MYYIDIDASVKYQLYGGDETPLIDRKHILRKSRCMRIMYLRFLVCQKRIQGIGYYVHCIVNGYQLEDGEG